MDEKSKKLVDTYLDFCSGLAERTQEVYRFIMYSFLKYFPDHKSWEDITVNDIIMYYKRYNHGKNSVIYKLNLLNRFYRWAIKEGYLLSNPVESFISTLKPEKKEREYLTKKQSEILLSSIGDFRYYIITLFMLRTGVRIAELRNLKLSDVNLRERTVFIRAGKGGKDRYTFFDHETEVKLNAWLRERELLNPKCDNLFVNTLGKPLKPVSVFYYTNQINELVKDKIDIRITPHILRHTFATECVENRMDLKTLSLILGHEDIKTTSIYLHKNKESLKREYIRTMVR
jgi:integrase/recombinase XerD